MNMNESTEGFSKEMKKTGQMICPVFFISCLTSHF